MERHDLEHPQFDALVAQCTDLLRRLPAGLLAQRTSRMLRAPMTNQCLSAHGLASAERIHDSVQHYVLPRGRVRDLLLAVLTA